MPKSNQPILVEIPVHTTQLGSLGVIEKSNPFPFEVKRIYFLYDVPSKAIRGSHAHKELNQLIVALSGSFTVNLDDGDNELSFQLSSPSEGLLIPPGFWRTLTNFSSGSAALVLASHEYDEADYIREYSDFLGWKNG